MIENEDLSQRGVSALRQTDEFASSRRCACNVLSSMYLPTRRAVTSPEPPGAKGTMMRIGLLGWTSVSAKTPGARAGCAASKGRARPERRESDTPNEVMALQSRAKP